MNTLSPTKRITLATFKSFINKNRSNLFVLHNSSFDGMTDCVQELKNIPHKIELTTEYVKHSLGIKGLWLVGSSRDYFKSYEDELFIGIEVSNCCGRSIVAVIK